jgi:GNAT superfamily N-acetyltransferase
MPNDRGVDVDIRLARVEDAAAVALLTQQLGYEVDPSDAAPKLSRILSRADQQLFIAESDGRPIAWLHAMTLESVETEAAVVIAGLVVDRTYRGKGIGRLLMDKAESWAASRGCGIVRLWSTASRHGAHQFYERLGYAKIKTQYSFAKRLDNRHLDLKRLVPRVDD